MPALPVSSHITVQPPDLANSAQGPSVSASVAHGTRLEAIARRIQTSRAGLDNPSKPIGVFMLAGPSGKITYFDAAEIAASVAPQDYGRAWPMWRKKALAELGL